MKDSYVYILASQKNGTLYIGLTSDLIKRILSNKKLLNESIFLATMTHQNPSSLVQGLEKLHEANYSSPEVQAKLFEHPEPEDLANGFLELRHISQLTPEYQ